MQQLTGLAITRYVGVDLAAPRRRRSTPSAACGVCVPRPVVDSRARPGRPDPGHGHASTRASATDFARAADVRGRPAGGRGRIERQQQVLAAVLGPGAVRTRACSTCAASAALRPALGHAVVTDGAELDQVLALARSLREPRRRRASTFAAVPTDPDPHDQGSVLRAGRGRRRCSTRCATDAPLPATATDGAASGPAAERTSPCDVLNASDRPGLAGKVADTLRGLGFRIGEVANAAQPTPQTVIRFSPDQTAAAQLLATTVPSATTVPDPGTTGVLQLVLGRSFDGVGPRADHYAVRISRTSTRRTARDRELRLTVVGRSPPVHLPIRFDQERRSLPSVHARRLPGPARRAGLDASPACASRSAEAHGQGDPRAAGERSAARRGGHHRGRPGRRAARPRRGEGVRAARAAGAGGHRSAHRGLGDPRRGRHRAHGRSGAARRAGRAPPPPAAGAARRGGALLRRDGPGRLSRSRARRARSSAAATSRRPPSSRPTTTRWTTCTGTCSPC